MGLKSRGWDAASANSPGHVTSVLPDRSISTSPEEELPALHTKPFSKYSVLPPIGRVQVEQHDTDKHVDEDRRRRTTTDLREYDVDMSSSRSESHSNDSSDTADNVISDDTETASTTDDDDVPAGDNSHSDNNRVISFRQNSSRDCAPPPILFNRDYQPEPAYARGRDSNDSNYPSGRDKPDASTTSELTDSSTDDEQLDRGCESEPAYQTSDLYEILRYPEERIYLSQSRNDDRGKAQSKCSFCREAELDCYCGEETDGLESSVERFLAEYRLEQEKKHADKVEELTRSKVPVDRDENYDQPKCSSEEQRMDIYSTTNQNEDESQHYFHEDQVESQSSITPEMIRTSVEQHEKEVLHSSSENLEINPCHFDDSAKDKNTCNPSEHSTIHAQHLSKNQSLLRPNYAYDLLTNINPMDEKGQSPTNRQSAEQLPLQNASDGSPSRALQFAQDVQLYWEKQFGVKGQVQGGLPKKEFRQPANDHCKDELSQIHPGTHQDLTQNNDYKISKGEQVNPKRLRHKKVKILRDSLQYSQGLHYQDSCQYNNSKYYTDDEEDLYQEDGHQDEYEDKLCSDASLDQRHLYHDNSQVDGFKEHLSKTNLDESLRHHKGSPLDVNKEHPSKTNLELNHQYHDYSQVDGFEEHHSITNLDASLRYHKGSRLDGNEEHPRKTNQEQSHQCHKDSQVDVHKELQNNTNIEQSHQYHEDNRVDGFQEHHHNKKILEQCLLSHEGGHCGEYEDQTSYTNLDQRHLYHGNGRQDEYEEQHRSNTTLEQSNLYHEDGRHDGYEEQHGSNMILEQSHLYHEDGRHDEYEEQHGSNTILEQSHLNHEDSNCDKYEEWHNDYVDLKLSHQTPFSKRQPLPSIPRQKLSCLRESSLEEPYQHPVPNRLSRERLPEIPSARQIYSSPPESHLQDSCNQREPQWLKLPNAEHIASTDCTVDDDERQSESSEDRTPSNDDCIDSRPIYHEGYVYYEYGGRYEDIFPQLSPGWDDMKLRHDHVESIVKQAGEYYHTQDYDDWKKEQRDCWAQVSQLPILYTDQMLERGDKKGTLYLRQKVETPSSVASDSGSETSSVPSPSDDESNRTPSPDNLEADAVSVSHQSTSNKSPGIGLLSHQNPFSKRQPLPSILRVNGSCPRESSLEEPYQHPVPNRLSRERLPEIPPARKVYSSSPESRSPSRQLPQRYPLHSPPTLSSTSSRQSGSHFAPRPPAAPRDSAKSRRLRSVRFNLNSSSSSSNER